jgi:NADH-quinone oxidoreductase subunit A
MLEAHLPLLIVLVVASVLAGAILFLSSVLGPKRPTPIKQAIFECGNAPTGDARERFNVKFYLVAILFLVFDIEAVFIYPWAVVFSDSTKQQGGVSPLLALVDMLVFVAIIVVGLAYAWRKGALEWSKS